MQIHTMALNTGHKVVFQYGQAAYITLLDEKPVGTFDALANALSVSVEEIRRFVGIVPARGETDDNTVGILMKLMCLCGYANTKNVA